jgi:type IV pilus assembly protein PilB
MEIKKTRRLGELLVESALITEQQLSIALEEQKLEHLPLGDILIKNGSCKDIDIAQTISMQLGIKYIELSSTIIEPEAIQLVPQKIALMYKLIPVCIDRTVLTIAMTDPLNLNVIDELTLVTRCKIVPAISTAREIATAISHHYSIADAVINLPIGLGSGVSMNLIEVVQENTSNIAEDMKKSELPPIIKLVNEIIFNAVSSRASDIHMEPQQTELKLRNRVDGLLIDVMQLPKWLQGALTSRIKIMAKLDITEKRLPQDGKIKVRVSDREIELRVSSLPSQYGEKIVIRILDTKSGISELSSSGLSNDSIKVVEKLIEKPHGIVLVTGPTGSGKSSTLYSMINRIKSSTINIITLEDPVEYEVSGITQVAINEKTGLTFAYGLRSVLRQDPDVVMVGEIRDNETATIAIQASLTGHLVLSTLHTNDTISSIVRLRDIGVPSYLIATSLNGIIAQRLARRICADCKEPYVPSLLELKNLGLTDIKGHTFYHGKGCPKCNTTGYKGRVGIFEVMVADAGMKELIRTDATEGVLKKEAMAKGMKLLKEDGLNKALAGLTTIEELMRILFVEEKEDVKECPNCSEKLQENITICPKCGHKLKDVCPACKKDIDPGWAFCSSCGEKLTLSQHAVM